MGEEGGFWWSRKTTHVLGDGNNSTVELLAAVAADGVISVAAGSELDESANERGQTTVSLEE